MHAERKPSWRVGARVVIGIALVMASSGVAWAQAPMPCPPSVDYYSISGNVGTAYAAVSAGVTSTSADANGTYTLSGLTAGTYAVTPSHPTCTFSPFSRGVTLGPDAAGVNFTATCPPPTYSISGFVGMANAMVTVGPTLVYSQGNEGWYSVKLLAGSYFVIPRTPNCDFAPRFKTVTLPPSVGDVNFSHPYCAPGFTVSGWVQNQLGAPIADAIVDASPYWAYTEKYGYYAIPLIPPGTLLTIKPRSPAGRVCTFDPTSRTVTMSSDVNNVNFTAYCLPGPPRFLTATARNASNKIEWLNPVDPTYVGTLLLRRAGGFPTGPADPAATIVVNDTGAFSGQHRTTLDLGLANNTKYYYAAFVGDNTGNYSAAKTVTATPLDTTLPVKWAYTTSAATLTPPAIWPGAIGVGEVVIISSDRVVHAMNPSAAGGDWPASPPFAWTPLLLDAPSQAYTPVIPFTVGGATMIVLVSSQDGHVYCVNGLTGAILWTSSQLGDIVQAEVTGILTQYGGKQNLLFAATRNATGSAVYALNPADGSIVWKFDNGGWPNGIGIIVAAVSPDYEHNRVYFTSWASGGSPNTVWCLDAATGAKLWAAALGDAGTSPVDRVVSTTPTNRLYLGTNAGLVYALNADTGAVLWSVNLGDGPVRDFVGKEFASDRMYTHTTNKVWALSDYTTSATIDWGVSLGAGVSPSWPVRLGAQIGVFGSDGKLSLLDSSTGATLQSLLIGGGNTGAGTPVFDVVNTMFYISTESGVIYAVAWPLP